MGDGIMGYFATARNPVACAFHVGFKIASMVCFLFLNAIIGEEIITFVIVVLFAAFDFWTVKNITGRLLVNLKWNTEIDDFGNEQWVYESDESKQALQAAAQSGDVDAKQKLEKLENTPGAKTDSRIFWSALYLAPIVWAFFIFGQLMSFKFFWLITAVICFTLSFTNAQGFYYCQKDHKAKLTEYITQRGVTMFMSGGKDGSMMSKMMGAAMYLPSMFGGGKK